MGNSCQSARSSYSSITTRKKYYANEEDNEEELLSMVKDGLNLVENDYLGGSGSRGYGRVKFHISE